jgi:hypothetical protein
MNTQQLLQSLLQQRILVLDGAMGTMIQKYKLREEDYRGERFKDYSILIQGKNDLLSLTQPDIIKDIQKITCYNYQLYHLKTCVSIIHFLFTWDFLKTLYKTRF